MDEEKQAPDSLAPFMGLVLEQKIAIFSLGLLFGYLLVFSAPPSFPKESTFIVNKGDTLGMVADMLKERKIIRSSLIFTALVRLSGEEKGLNAGEYQLRKKESTFSIVGRMVSGDYGFSPVRITIPEGLTTHEMSKLFEERILHFDKDKFISLTETKEGYLFPDTYEIYPNTSTEDVIKILEDNFYKKTIIFNEEIKSSGKTLKDIIIMASIIEREALKKEDRFLVSGILWKRISIEMPLQVDAPFAYVSDKSTYELTTEDLSNDFPYNTYRRKGLTPTPIGNPGLLSIEASLRPKASKYLYYLSDRSGNMHYAVTFEEHKKNKMLYFGR